MHDINILPPLKLFIDNAWVDAQSEETFDILSPATGDTLGSCHAAGAVDVDRAVRAAKKSFESWSIMDGAARGALLWRLADLIEAGRERLATLEAIDVGRPFGEVFYAELPAAIATLRHFAGWADKISGSTYSLPPFGGAERFSYTLRQPLGVVGAITPWNAPTMIAIWKIAPALAAGNTIVLKPAEDAPLTALALADLFVEAGFPPGVFNVVPGLGTIAGAALSTHPHISKLSFTGSTAVGKKIAAVAGEHLKKVTLELGGKSPQIIWPDADLEKITPIASLSVFANQGQTCASGSRIYCHRSIIDKFVAMMKASAESLQVGHPLAPETQMGSVINAKQLNRILAYIDGAISQGATLITGGNRKGTTGCFIEPTVFVGTNDLTIAREEIFGPVATIIPFDTDEEVLEFANENSYGLTAVLWTNDSKRINTFVKNLEAGVVWINAWGPPHPALPWLGVKASGIGEELGYEGLISNTKIKTVNLLAP